MSQFQPSDLDLQTFNPNDYVPRDKRQQAENERKAYPCIEEVTIDGRKAALLITDHMELCAYLQCKPLEWLRRGIIPDPDPEREDRHLFCLAWPSDVRDPLHITDAFYDKSVENPCQPLDFANSMKNVRNGIQEFRKNRR